MVALKVEASVVSCTQYRAYDPCRCWNVSQRAQHSVFRIPSLDFFILMCSWALPTLIIPIFRWEIYSGADLENPAAGLQLKQSFEGSTRNSSEASRLEALNRPERSCGQRSGNKVNSEKREPGSWLPFQDLGLKDPTLSGACSDFSRPGYPCRSCQCS